MRRARGKSERMTEVMVLHACLDDQFDAARCASLLERLPYARRLELERRRPRLRLPSLLGIALLGEGVRRLCGVPLDPALLRYPDTGKPRLDGGPSFSISHSMSRVAVALAETDEPGLDLEVLRPGRQDRALLERWTATEATLKALGAGLRRLRDVRLADDLTHATLDGNVVLLRSVLLASDCIARLATFGPVTALEVRECDAAVLLPG